MRPPVRIALLPLFLFGVAGTCWAQVHILIAPYGENEMNAFGRPIATAGDVNGDGYPDVLMCATGWPDPLGGSSYGRVYLYYGGPYLDDVADVTFSGSEGLTGYSIAAATVGDMNGDGFDDILVGAPNADVEGMDRGRVHLYFGGAPPDETPDLVLLGEAEWDQFGRSVAGVGDVNDDGHPDFVVGAALNDAAGTMSGRAYVYFGGPGLDDAPDLVLTPGQSQEHFGYSSAPAGDVNGDDHPDFLVGAPGLNARRVYVFHGGPALDDSPDLIIEAPPEAAGFGYRPAGAGDVNGDGWDDIIAGAASDSSLGDPTGAAYLFLGGAAADGIPDAFYSSGEPGSRFGDTVSSADDLNDDGYADLIIGAHYADGSTGRAYVYHGGDPLNSDPDMVLTGDGTGERFGYPVCTLGDVNLNGTPDLGCGAHINPTGGIATGRGYVLDIEPSVSAPTDDGEHAITIRVHPNPVSLQSSRVMLDVGRSGRSIVLYDVRGRRVDGWRRVLDQAGRLELDLGGLKAGVYFVAVDNEVGERLVVMP